MKLGVFTVALANKSFEDACKYLSSHGVEMIEVGCGGYPGKAHADPEVLLKDDKKIKKMLDTVKKYGLEISALSCHSNPIHPDKEIAKQFDDDLRNCILLAEKMGIHQINTFSGCPGDCENSKYPNWVTCSWPEDYMKILEWQWNEVLIPYWKEFVVFAKEHGVDKIAFEPHPGFCVYNAETLLKLRAAVGDEIGANLDPSHLFWQGSDPVAAIKALKGAIFHFHAKDTYIDKYNTAINGVLDTKHYSGDRSWTFRTVGYGHGAETWNAIISALKSTGYDYAISIEHEDLLMSMTEGLEKAIEFLNGVLIKEKSDGMWWA
jgi:sugar phosphate isomerase/epimerase